MHTLLWRKRALAIQRSCLSPTEKFSPFSMTSLSSLPGSALIFSFIFVRSMASQITSSSYIWKGSKLYLKIQKSLWRLQRKIIFIWNCDSHLTVPIKSTGSWGIMESFERRSSKPISEMLIPSISIIPDVKSTNRKSATPNDDFPEPVLPTIPAENFELAYVIRIALLMKYQFFLWVECGKKHRWELAANSGDNVF